VIEGLLFTPMAPIMKSLAFVVVLDAVACDPVPVLVTALPSKGDVVLAPLIPNATAAALPLPLKLMVIEIVPLEEDTAYHVSTLTPP
jgi:hypothetical protein